MKWTKGKPIEAGIYWYKTPNDERVHLVGLQKRIEPNGEDWMLCVVVFYNTIESDWSYDFESKQVTETDEMCEGDLWLGPLSYPTPPPISQCNEEY